MTKCPARGGHRYQAADYIYANEVAIHQVVISRSPGNAEQAHRLRAVECQQYQFDVQGTPVVFVRVEIEPRYARFGDASKNVIFVEGVGTA
jgi:hypothetical protein